eukprot:UN01435
MYSYFCFIILYHIHPTLGQPWLERECSANSPCFMSYCPEGEELVEVTPAGPNRSAPCCATFECRTEKAAGDDSGGNNNVSEILLIIVLLCCVMLCCFAVVFVIHRKISYQIMENQMKNRRNQ